MPDKKSSAGHPPVPIELVARRIYLIRGQRIMLDSDLAELYQVPTKALNQAVRRNVQRFPEDFMFQLTGEEADFLRSQFVTSKPNRGGRRYLPYAFTEPGVWHVVFSTQQRPCGSNEHFHYPRFHQTP
jgi:hypothetical protein